MIEKDSTCWILRGGGQAPSVQGQGQGQGQGQIVDTPRYRNNENKDGSIPKYTDNDDYNHYDFNGSTTHQVKAKAKVKVKTKAVFTRHNRMDEWAASICQMMLWKTFWDWMIQFISHKDYAVLDQVSVWNGFDYN